MFRRLFILSLTVVAWLGSLTLLGVSQTVLTERTRGVENPLMVEALPYRVPRLGVTAELLSIPPDELPRHLALMQETGVTWVRQYAYWDVLEPTRGQYIWDEFDRVFDALADFPSLRPIIVFQNSPSWAIDPEATDPTGPPQDPNDLAAFAEMFARRYGASVDHYQVWDEPNLFTNWGGLQPRAARYAALLEAVHSAVHAADPDQTVVISAGLAPTVELGPDNVSDWLYLRDLYTLGAGAFMDAVGAKPYGFDTAHDDRRVDARVLNFSRVIGLRDIMIEHGDAGKAIWGSHWGWNSLPPDWAGRPSTWGSVSQAQQIDHTLGALARVEREWPWMAGLTIHHWNPPFPADHPQQGFALTTPSGQSTALLDALIAADIEPLNTSAGVGWHPAKTAHAQYSGLWTFTDYGADIGWQRDSRLRFQFDGQTVGLILRQDNYVANLYPTVNAAPADSLPKDADGRSYLTLTSDTLLPTVGVVSIARNLAHGRHTLEVIADQGFDRYALVGYAVGVPDVAPPLLAQRNVAFLTVLISTLCMGTALVFLPWGRWFARLAVLWKGLAIPVQIVIGIVTSLALMLSVLLTWGQELPALLRREPVLPALALLSVGLAYLNLTTLITLAAAAVLFWCIYHRLALGLVLTLGFAPFFLFPVELYRFAFPMAELILLLTGGAWVLRGLAAWGQRRRDKRPIVRSWRSLNALDIIAAAYLLSGALALTWSAYLDPALTEFRTLFVEPVLFYAVFRTTRPTLAEQRWIVLALVAAGVTVSVIGLFQYLTDQAIITAEDASRRLAGVYGSPNNLALFLGRVIPFTLAAVLLSKSGRWRVAAAIALGITGLTALLTQSVGGVFIGIPAALAVVLMIAWGRRGVLGVLAMAILVIVGFAIASSQSERFARALDFSQGTNFYRVRVMQSAVQILQDRPLTGLGLDQFLYAFRGVYIYPDAWPEPNLSHPHNIVLDFWVRLGLLGVGVLVAWLIVLPLRLYRLYRQATSTFWRVALLGIIGALTNTLVHGMLDNSIFVIDLAIVFFALLALISSLERTASYGTLARANTSRSALD